MAGCDLAGSVGSVRRGASSRVGSAGPDRDAGAADTSAQRVGEANDDAIARRIEWDDARSDDKDAECRHLPDAHPHGEHGRQGVRQTPETGSVSHNLAVDSTAEAST